MENGLGSGFGCGKATQQATKRLKFKRRSALLGYDPLLADTAPPYKEPPRPAKYTGIMNVLKTKHSRKSAPPPKKPGLRLIGIIGNLLRVNSEELLKVL